MTTNIHVSDVRGAGKLTIDAIRGITDIVEDMHQTIASIAGIFGDLDRHRTSGITGLVYWNIRMMSSLVGVTIDIMLDHIARFHETKESTPAREAVLAIINGVLGDHLLSSGNPMAIQMQFRRDGKPLVPNDPAFLADLQKSDGKIALLVHGSCMNDLQWRRRGHDHGAALAKDLGYLPLYLHYNTGRHISENGKELSGLLENLVHQLPHPLEIVIIAHSMGGLVSRSACYYGKEKSHLWMDHLRKIVFLGTPHHGAPLERGGNWIDYLLQISPYSSPLARLGKIRSAGVTDMRYGNILDDDWIDYDRFNDSRDFRTVVPLPDNVQCYAIAVTLGKEANCFGDHLIGDGLVTLNSALGRSRRPVYNLEFPRDRQWIGRHIHHLDLLNHNQVYETIKEWLQAD